MANKTPEYLIKFCSADGADSILSTQTLRWSAPHHFNDVFELDYQSQLNFSSSELLRALVEQSLKLIFQLEKPLGGSQVLQAINRWRDEERFDDPEEATEILTELLSQVVIARKPALKKLLNNWRSYALRNRICCFCDHPDNLASWQTYADNHKGVALKFRSGMNTTLGIPKKIIYQETRPEITSLNEQISDIMLNQTTRYSEEFPKKFLSKPRVFTAEGEWRCFRLLANSPEILLNSKESGMTDIAFQASDLKEVYFGANMSPETKQKLSQKVKVIDRKIKIFDTHLNGQRYQLDFIDNKKSNLKNQSEEAV